jgi:hypothetical protein
MEFIINPEIRYLKCIMPIVQTKVSAIKTKVTTLCCVRSPSGVESGNHGTAGRNRTTAGWKNLKPDRVTAIYRQHHARDIF